MSFVRTPSKSDTYFLYPDDYNIEKAWEKFPTKKIKITKIAAAISKSKNKIAVHGALRLKRFVFAK